MGLMWNSNAKINTFIKLQVGDQNSHILNRLPQQTPTLKLHTWLVLQPPQIVFVNYVVMSISHSLDCPTLS